MASHALVLGAGVDLHDLAHGFVTEHVAAGMCGTKPPIRYGNPQMTHVVKMSSSPRCNQRGRPFVVILFGGSDVEEPGRGACPVTGTIGAQILDHLDVGHFQPLTGFDHGVHALFLPGFLEIAAKRLHHLESQ